VVKATQPIQGMEVSGLYEKVRAVLEEARARTIRTANTEMVRAYWLIGQAIVEQEQQGQECADYGERLIESLSERLAQEFGKGFQPRNLWWMRDFYLTFPNLNALRSELTWTHYRLLLRVENPDARACYETEAAEGNWSTRQLERQINSHFYERTLLSKRKRALLTQTRAEAEAQTSVDFVRDPSVLEFLGLRESKDYLERGLEAAILDHLQEFLLELGKGFAFVGRQIRLTLDGDHFYIDLVFYNSTCPVRKNSRLNCAGSRSDSSRGNYWKEIRPHESWICRTRHYARKGPGTTGRVWESLSHGRGSRPLQGAGGGVR